MPSMWRQPLAIVTIGGVQVDCEEVTVDQAKKAESGKCSFIAPLTAMEAVGLGLDWIADAEEDSVQVTFSTGEGDDTVMFTGTVDKADVDITLEGQPVTISCRDKSSDMHSSRTNEKFINQKSEEIVKTIAARHGLTLVTDGGTAMAGSIYTAEQAHLTSNQTEWSLCQQLATKEGKVLFIVGVKLYFKKIDDSSLPTYPIVYTPPSVDGFASVTGPSFDVVKLKLGRNYKAAKDTTVNVKSWDHKKKQLVTSTQTASGAGGPSQTYDYYPHHLTQEAADHLAKGKAKEHTRHEFDLTIEMPGDLTLTPLFQIALSGTNSKFDQNYAIDHISHKITQPKGGGRGGGQGGAGHGGSGGYAMSITTKAAKKGRNKDD